MIPIVIVRPEPGWTRTARAARALGLEVAGAPFFAIAALDWQAPRRDGVDAILLGSANAVRHAGPQLARFVGKPTYAVGAATAAVARESGLLVVEEGLTDLQALAPAIAPEHRRLLRLCGEVRTVFDPPRHATVEEIAIYTSRPLPMDADLGEVLRDEALVLLHSPRAAQHFAAECDRRGIARGGLAIAALSTQVARAAGAGWRSVDVPSTPRDEALLAMAETLCQKMAGQDRRASAGDRGGD